MIVGEEERTVLSREQQRPVDVRTEHHERRLESAAFRKITDLVEGGSYAEAAEALREAVRSNEWQVPDGLAEAAIALLKAGEQCVTEAKLHQEAFSDAMKRERTLMLRLHQLLTSRRQARRSSAPAITDSSITTTPAGPLTPGIDMPRETRGLLPDAAKPALMIYGLGEFRVLDGDGPKDSWHGGGKSRTLFKYLLLHRRAPVAKETLIHQFWADSDTEHARNCLNVAVYGVRRSLAGIHSGFSHVLFSEGSYQINPELQLWIDWEAFSAHVQAGQELEHAARSDQAIAEYRAALDLYAGPLMIEDGRDDWLAPEQTRLQEMALDTLRRMCRLSGLSGDLAGSIECQRRLLELDPCDETAHRDLMILYNRLDQPHLALRQFQICTEALARQLKMIPSQQTVALYHQIRRRQCV